MPSRPLRRVVLLAPALIIAGCTAPGPAAQPPASASAPHLSAPKPSTPTTTEPGIGASGAGEAYYPDDGNGGYDAREYRVGLGFDPATGEIDGDSTMIAATTAQLARFNLDLRGLDVTSVEVNGQAARFAREGAHELIITPADPIGPAGTVFTTRVRYHGKPVEADSGTLGTNGWRRTSAGGAFVMGEPHAATVWYPVNDTPRDKAAFRLTARVPEGWQVASIGRPGEVTTKDGWTTFGWEEPGQVASYLTTVAIEHFTLEQSALPDGTPLVSAYAGGADAARGPGGRLPEILDFLAARFGKYPQSAAGGIYLNEPVGYSLETQTRPIYTRGADLQTVVHENAHQWFGDSVSVGSWADICLNECLAQYAQWLWSEAKEGVDLDTRYHQQVDRKAGDRGFWAQRLYDMGPGKEFNGVYDKGVLAIHALRRLIGEDTFARVLREWPAGHAGGNASWPDFESFVGQITGRDLRGFFDAWFRGTTIPAEPDLYPGSLTR